jgi:hypothetical protein
VECGLQIVRKTGLLGILIALAWPVWSADGGEKESSEAPLVYSESGHVVGYISLPVGEQELPATLISEQLGEPLGKVLILHDSGGGIAGAGLVETLRLALPESGWTTMTVALNYPYSPKLFVAESTDDNEIADASDLTEADEQSAEAGTDIDTEQADNNARISAALAYLNAQQPGPTVIVALGEAVPLAISAASQQGDDKAQIWIAADMTFSELPELGPLLDIAPQDVGKKNTDALSRAVFMRQANNPIYSQRRLVGTGHDFQGFENQVLTTVRAWLQKQFKSEGQG